MSNELKTEKVELVSEDLPVLDRAEPDVPMRPIMDHPVLVGLYIPRETGTHKAVVKQAWLEAVQMIMSKGVFDPVEINKATGLPTRVIKQLQDAVYQEWGQSATPELVNTRREKLFTEIERIKSSAWDYYNEGKQNGADVREQGALLKLILESTSHQARMCGVNNVNLQLTHQVEAKFKTSEDFEREASTLLKVDPAVLKSLGSVLAQNMGLDEDE